MCHLYCCYCLVYTGGFCSSEKCCVCHFILRCFSSTEANFSKKKKKKDPDPEMKCGHSYQQHTSTAVEFLTCRKSKKSSDSLRYFFFFPAALSHAILTNNYYQKPCGRRNPQPLLAHCCSSTVITLCGHRAAEEPPCASCGEPDTLSAEQHLLPMNFASSHQLPPSVMNDSHFWIFCIVFAEGQKCGHALIHIHTQGLVHAHRRNLILLGQGITITHNLILLSLGKHKTWQKN